jgi:hypothetical protein
MYSLLKKERLAQQVRKGMFPNPVWSKNSSSVAVSKTLKCFHADEFIEGTTQIVGQKYSDDK